MLPTQLPSVPDRLVIAARQSPLAIWQAEHVRQAFLKHYPKLIVDIKGFKTTGDKVLDQPLSQIGGKGLFTKELEEALLDGRADLAVHSMKDVPMVLPEGFILPATLARENASDAFVSSHYESLDTLPEGALIGTSSLRRAALVKIFYPRLRVLPLRGNLQTRLQKLDGGMFDGIILASAGLIRLGLTERIREYLAPERWLPAPGQGALAIETLALSPYQEFLQSFNDPMTEICVRAERSFSLKLGGSCRVPLGAYAKIEQDMMILRGMLATPEGTVVFSGEKTVAMEAAASLGEALACELISYGAPGCDELVKA